MVGQPAAQFAAGEDLHQNLPVRRFDLAIRRHLPEPPTSAIELVQYQAPETPDRRGWQSLGDPAWGQLRGEPCLQWCWSGAAPERMTWHRPVVALELPDGRVVTDAHGELEVEYQPRRRSRLHTYARFTLSSRRG